MNSSLFVLHSSLSKVLHLRHHSEPVASPNLGDILLAILAAQQLEGEVDEFRRISKSSDAAISIKVGTQTYMVDAHHIDGMLQMGNGIHDVGLALLAQESMIERGMSHTTTWLPGHASGHRSDYGAHRRAHGCCYGCRQ